MKPSELANPVSCFHILQMIMFTVFSCKQCRTNASELQIPHSLYFLHILSVFSIFNQLQPTDFGYCPTYPFELLGSKFEIIEYSECLILQSLVRKREDHRPRLKLLRFLGLSRQTRPTLFMVTVTNSFY